MKLCSWNASLDWADHMWVEQARKQSAMHIHSGLFVKCCPCRKVVLVDLSLLQWQKKSRRRSGRFYCTRCCAHMSGSFHVWLHKHIIEQAEKLERRPACTFLYKLMVVRASTLKYIIEVPKCKLCHVPYMN